MGLFDNFRGHIDVVVVACRGRTVSFQRSVHHDGGESIFDGTHAGLDAVSMVLMHDDRNVRVEFRCRKHQVSQVGVLRVFSSAARSLYDDR